MGTFRDRWRARDTEYRFYTVCFWVWIALAIVLGNAHFAVLAFVSSVAAGLHARLATITASLHSRSDERTGDEVR